MDTEKYIKGFNNGYILAGHKPELAKALANTNVPGNKYLEGLHDGKGQLGFENGQEKLWELEALRNNSNEKENNFERE